MERPAQPDDTLSVLALVNPLLRHRTALLGIVAACVVLVGTCTVLQPRTWTASASFLPQSSEGGTPRVATLAAQFGFDLGGGGDGLSPAFYQDLINSRAILHPAVETPYEITTVVEGDTTVVRDDLIDLYEVEGRTQASRREEAVSQLRENLRVNIDSETGVVTTTVTEHDPALAAAILRRLFDLVVEFNLQTRQSQARAERAFVEDRIEQSRAELREAEQRLESFLERNRRYENSPQLRFEADRLEREVSLKQEVLTQLSQSFEQARMDEVRNTPVITVVEPPIEPAKPDRAGLIRNLVLAILLGLVLGASYAYGREYAGSLRAQDPSRWESFETQRREIASGIRRVLHRTEEPKDLPGDERPSGD